MNNDPRIGPIALCVVVCADLDRSAAAYTDALGLVVSARFSLDADTAAAIGMPSLVGADAQTLTNSQGRQWLIQVAGADATPRDALSTYGWMAQEIVVEDVDGLAASLEGSAFTVLRPPRDLDLGSTIRACQVLGPDGEILYLTQVNGEMEGSELPQNAVGVDHLFIAVMSTPDREQSLAQYEAISGGFSTCFDTRISVVNQHRGWDLEKKHPIATVQFAGRSLIEIDGLVDTAEAPAGICLGTSAMVFAASGPAPDGAVALTNGPLAGHAAVAETGFAGERYTLLYGSD